jgi:peptidoglycan/LPS O-acetylase OafA/YrhL
MQSRRLTIIGHLPLNHSLRGLYRTIIAVGGLLLVLYGILWIVANGSPIGGDGESVLGLRGNGTFGSLSLLMGVVLVVAAVLGRNLDHWAGFVVALLSMAIGVLGLALIRTTPEPFALSAATCVALLSVGAVLMCASSYVGTGSEDEARHRARASGMITAAEFENAQSSN